MSCAKESPLGENSPRAAILEGSHGAHVNAKSEFIQVNRKVNLTPETASKTGAGLLK